MESLYLHTLTVLARTPDDDFELSMGVRQSGPESPPLFNLFIDFVMRVPLGKCTSISIKFIQLKFRIPASTTHSKRTTIGQFSFDCVVCANHLVLLFEDIINLELALDVLSTTFKRYHLEFNISQKRQ